MPDPIFADPRLATIYDDLDADRRDLDVYADLVDEFESRSVLDVGCGTGSFACRLARRGLEVTAVDPAAASLKVARAKLGADRVRWILGDATSLPPLRVDLATMTGNVAQVFLTDSGWLDTLNGIRRALGPNGRLVFEVRDPSRQAWRSWNRARSLRKVKVADGDVVESWVDVLAVNDSLVTFRWTYRFERSGDVVTSDSTLRFRDRGEVKSSLCESGFRIRAVRDAPDRPGLEFVFVAEPTSDLT